MGSEMACAACVGLGTSSTVTVVNTVTVDGCSAAAAPALFGLGNGNNGKGKRALRPELARTTNALCVVWLLLATEGASAAPTISKIRNAERSASLMINHLAGNACVVSCAACNKQKGLATRKGTLSEWMIKEKSSRFQTRCQREWKAYCRKIQDLVV
jgi:hypothetical protein